MHTHIKAFEAKHNVGYRTFALLTLLALETNTFASLGLIEGTYPSTVPPVGVMDSQAGISTVDPQDDTYREARAPEYAKKEIQ